MSNPETGGSSEPQSVPEEPQAELVQFPPSVWQEHVPEEEQETVKARLITLAGRIHELDEELQLLNDAIKNERFDKESSHERQNVEYREVADQRFIRRTARSFAERFLATDEEKAKIKEDKAKEENRKKPTYLSYEEKDEIVDTINQTQLELEALLHEQADLEEQYLTAERRAENERVAANLGKEHLAKRPKKPEEITHKDLSGSQLAILNEAITYNRTSERLDRETVAYLYYNRAKLSPLAAGYLKERSQEADIALLFNLNRNQVAFGPKGITEETKLYNGEINPSVITEIIKHNIEHVYSNFPEGKVRSQLTIGGKSAEELIDELKGKKPNLLSSTIQMIGGNDFKTSAEPETVELIKLRVADLGFSKESTTAEVYARAEELGLKLCPAEVGPHQRIQETNQFDDSYSIAMKQIMTQGLPCIFYLSGNDSYWLYDYSADPLREWKLNEQFMFRLPKPSLET